MKQKKRFWMIAAILIICGFASCSNEDRSAEGRLQGKNTSTKQGQQLEVYGVNGSEATARLTIDGVEIFTTSVYIGKNGIGKTGEGDAKTPTGTLHPLTAFGVKENPGTKMPYIDVTPSIFA